MAIQSARPCGDFRTSYASDATIFPTRGSLLACALGIALLLALPLVLDRYALSLLLYIGIYGIAALGLNLLTGCTGQISLGHAAFFGFGAFASTWFNNKLGVPVPLAIPLAGLATTLVGIVVGLPAARIKGLYLAIATLAAQYILEDFFARADWFSGGAAGARANPYALFGLRFAGESAYFYVVLAHLVVLYVFAANLLRTRDGCAFVAVRDHYLSAEVMGVDLTRYKVLAFGISTFYAAIAGALMAHYVGFVSSESVNILLSIQFFAMIIIGGMGSIMGSLMGAAFMVLLPEALEGAVHALKATGWGDVPQIVNGLSFAKEAAIGLAIVLFLIFEPQGLAHRWRLIKAYWKLYPFAH
jgi:branched-chain amino acid transport system permease protein